MLYDYKCENCEYNMVDVYQSIKDDPLTECPSCGKDTLSRVIYGGLGSFMKDIKTVGQLADRNWSKMGHYQKSEIESKVSQQKPKESNPFGFAGNASKKDINKMTPSQRERYIMTGEK